MNAINSLFNNNDYYYNTKPKSSFNTFFAQSKSMQNVSNNEKEDVIPEGMSEERYWEIKEAAEHTQQPGNNVFYLLGGKDPDKSLYSFAGYAGSGATGPKHAANFYYAEHSTPENPCIIAEGFDEYGNVFYEEIYTNDVDPQNANTLEAYALLATLGEDATTIFSGSEHYLFDKIDIYQEAQEIYAYQAQYGSSVQHTLDELKDIMNALEKHATQNGFQCVDSSKSNYRAPAMTPNTPSYIKQAYYKLSYNNYFAS